jgi:hypothetical protein
MSRILVARGRARLLLLLPTCGGAIEPEPDQIQAAPVTPAPPFACSRPRDCNDARLTRCTQLGDLSDGTRGPYTSTCSSSCTSTPVTPAGGASG